MELRHAARRRDYEGGNLAEIWQSAQHRRTEDIYFWFTHFFERQQQPKSSDSRPRFPRVELLRCYGNF
jgi:hypothetical protein